MRKLASVTLIAIALLLVAAPPSEAGSRGRHRGPAFRSHVFIGVGPAFAWRPYPYWYYPPAYYYPAYYYPAYYPAPYVYVPPPTVVVEQAPVYAPPPVAPQAYWYYCESVGGYYPTVQTCPEAWLKVPPRSE